MRYATHHPSPIHPSSPSHYTQGELYNGIGKGKLNKGQATGFGRGRGKGKLGQTTGKGKGISGASTKDRQKAVAQSRRAGLTFPVGRIHKMMKENLLHGARVSGTGAVYVAAVLEYLCAEILHIAMDAASVCKTIFIFEFFFDKSGLAL